MVIPRMMNSTQGMATLLPNARYRAESEASERAVQPSGNPWSRSHSSGVRRRSIGGYLPVDIPGLWHLYTVWRFL